MIALAIGIYSAGYKQGGEDFAYLDHMMIGMLSNSEIKHCEENEDPHDCYKWSQELSIGHAFVFYTQHNEKLSPIARYVFPDSYEGYFKSVSNLYTLVTETDHGDLCNYLLRLGEKEFKERKQEIMSFIKLAGPHINKSILSKPSAAGRR